MPKPPKYLDKVQALTTWIDNPCDAPWVLYFETAKAPAGRFIIGMMEFGMTDVISAMFRPKGFRSGRHGRKGRRGKKKGGGIPSIPDLWAERMPGMEEIKGRQVTAGVQTMWVVYGGLQRLLNWFQIIDLTETFFTEWASAINETYYCRAAQKGRGFNENLSPGVITGVSPHFISTFPNHYVHGSLTMGQFYATFGAGTWRVMFSIEVTRRDATDCNSFQPFMLETISNEIVAEATAGFLAPGETKSFVLAATVKGPGNIQFLCNRSFGNILQQNANVFVMQE